jgi:pimeloyl-ACP methyl ester carboxylesterase
VWAGCGGGFECTTLDAPLDWDHPDGRTTPLALIRLKASGPGARIGSLFVNPGGPGASAVDLARNARGFLRPAVLARFDVVAVDPRGVGHSSPITCESGADLDQYFDADPTPDTPAERDHLIDVNRQLAEACARSTGDLLGHIDTRTAARDMDYARAALGDDRMTYVGFSYGTFLGATYADLFPNRVRALVLDGAVDPALSVQDVNREQAIGFQKSFDAFLADCAAQSSCPLRADGDPRAAYDRLTARVEAQPIRVGGRQVGPGELFLAVVAALYRKADWLRLSTALHAANGGDGAPLLSLADGFTERQADGTYGTLLTANAAVNCIDRPWSTNVADYDADAKAFAAQAPDFGAAVAYGGLACAFWKAPAVDTAHPLHAAGAAPILVIGTTNDPATPYQWAKNLAAELQSGVLLTHVGEGHTSLASPSSCVIDIETAYLVDLTVPAPNTTC